MSVTQRQRSNVYALFDEPPIVFVCQISAAFSTHDKVAEIPFGTVSVGTISDVLPGMTVMVGTQPGSNDIGITFARKAPSATVFYIGETSEIDWQTDLYLTVIEEFGIWAEHLVIRNNNMVYMKYDVAYTDQHENMKPIPNIGTDRVLRLSGVSVSTVFDGAGSVTYAGTIISHTWSCEGASAIVTDGSQATLTFEASGRYLLKYTVTTDLGASSDSYRVIWVYQGPTDENVKISEVVAGDLSGIVENGGWEFDVTVIHAGTEANPPYDWIRERTKVVLFAEEWEGDSATPVSYGDVPGSENIIAIGWVHQESIQVDAEGGQVSFLASGTASWLQRVYSFIPVGFQNKTNLNWIKFNGLTIDKALWNLVMWRSTISNCVDINLTGDTKLATELSAPNGSLWEQIRSLANESILATACCNRYGALFVEVDSSLTPEAERTSIPVKGSIIDDDYVDIEITKELATLTSQVVLSGVAVVGDKGKALFSLSRGHIPTHYGVPKTVDKLLLADQTQANELAAMILEKENPPFRAKINGLWNHDRTVDLCPRQFVNLTIAGPSNGRGLAYDDNVIVRSMSMSYEDGYWSADWEVEPETHGLLSVNGDVPGTNDGSSPWSPPSLPPTPITPIVPPPSEGPGQDITPVGKIAILFQSGSDNGVWMLDALNDTTVWSKVTGADWAEAEIGAVKYIEVDPTQNLFLASDKKVWRQKLSASSPRTTIADETKFEGLYPHYGPEVGGIYYKIHATGMMSEANGFCCLVGIAYPTYRQGLHKYDGSALKQEFLYSDPTGKTGFTPADFAPGGGIVFSDKRSYIQISAGTIHAPPGRLVILEPDLSDYAESPSGVDFTGGIWNKTYFPCVAGDADIVYTWHNSTDRLVKISNSGSTVDDLSDLIVGQWGKMNRIACDPSGKHVWFGVGDSGLQRSYNYGALPFQSVTSNFPSLSYNGTAATNINNMKVINLGDEFRWLAVFTATVYVSAGTTVDNYVHVFFTPDNGQSWENWSDGFHTDPMDPGPGLPKAVRYV